MNGQVSFEENQFVTWDGWYGSVDSVVALELGSAYPDESKLQLPLLLHWSFRFLSEASKQAGPVFGGVESFADTVSCISVMVFSSYGSANEDSA